MSLLAQIKKSLTRRKIRKLNERAYENERLVNVCNHAACMYQTQALELRIKANAMNRELSRIVRGK